MLENDVPMLRGSLYTVGQLLLPLKLHNYAWGVMSATVYFTYFPTVYAAPLLLYGNLASCMFAFILPCKISTSYVGLIFKPGACLVS